MAPESALPQVNIALEAPGITLAHFQLFAVSAQLDREIAQLVTAGASDGAYGYQGAAVDFPELGRVKALLQLLERGAHQAFIDGADDPRVAAVAIKKQHFFNRENLDAAAGIGADPAYALSLRARAQVAVHLAHHAQQIGHGSTAGQLRAQALHGLGQAL